MSLSNFTLAQVKTLSKDHAEKANWRSKAKPIKEGSVYPAKELCSHCGLCDTYYVAHVKDACAFLGDGKPFPLDHINLVSPGI